MKFNKFPKTLRQSKVGGEKKRWRKWSNLLKIRCSHCAMKKKNWENNSKLMIVHMRLYKIIERECMPSWEKKKKKTVKDVEITVFIFIDNKQYSWIILNVMWLNLSRAQINSYSFCIQANLSTYFTTIWLRFHFFFFFSFRCAE